MEKDIACYITSAKAIGTNLSATPLRGVASSVPLTDFTQTFLCLIPLIPPANQPTDCHGCDQPNLRILYRPTTLNSFFEVQSSRLDLGSLDKSLTVIIVGYCCDV